MSITNPEQVANIVDSWLRYEVVNSNSGRNNLLDDYTAFRTGLSAGHDDPANIDTLKSDGHFSRFNHALQLREAGIDNDFSLAKLTHHALMFVSGGFRTYAYLRASDQKEYEAQRFGTLFEPNGASTVNIAQTTDQVWEKCSDSKSPITLSSFIGEARASNRAIVDGIKTMHQWMHEHNVGTQSLDKDSLPLRIAHERQRLGLVVAISHIALVAAERDGDLARVPMLEPKSISDVSTKPLYPFI